MWPEIYIGRRVKYPLFLSDFHETCVYSTYFRKIPEYKISWSVQREPSCSMRTNMTKLIVASRSFANAPKVLLHFFLYLASYNWNCKFNLFVSTKWWRKAREPRIGKKKEKNFDLCIRLSTFSPGYNSRCCTFLVFTTYLRLLPFCWRYRLEAVTLFRINLLCCSY